MDMKGGIINNGAIDILIYIYIYLEIVNGHKCINMDISLCPSTFKVSEFQTGQTDQNKTARELRSLW